MGLETYWATDPSDVLRVRQGFLLADVDTRSTPGFESDKSVATDSLAAGAMILAELQEKLFAGKQMGDDPRRILLVLQAMDTAGKGGIVKHVVSAVDPQGVQFAAFKTPTEEELAQDFLWRIRKRLPDAGMIGVFDRHPARPSSRSCCTSRWTSRRSACAVPADRKWYARLAVQHLLIEALEAMRLEWPLADFDVEAEKARLEAS